MKILFLFLLLIAASTAAPWFNLLFNQKPYNYENSGYENRRQGKSGNNRWKEICRVINPDPYTFPGRVPYPSSPVCPW